MRAYMWNETRCMVFYCGCVRDGYVGSADIKEGEDLSLTHDGKGEGRLFVYWRKASIVACLSLCVCMNLCDGRLFTHCSNLKAREHLGKKRRIFKPICPVFVRVHHSIRGLPSLTQKQAHTHLGLCTVLLFLHHPARNSVYLNLCCLLNNTVCL